MFANRESFYAVPPPGFETLEVPGLGTVRVKPLTAGERDRFEQAGAESGGKYVRARFLVAGVVDEAGRPIFTDDDLPRLDELPAAVVQPVVEAIARLGKLTPEDMKELEKNSGSGPSAA